jgi:hypothetical protein
MFEAFSGYGTWKRRSIRCHGLLYLLYGGRSKERTCKRQSDMLVYCSSSCLTSVGCGDSSPNCNGNFKNMQAHVRCRPRQSGRTSSHLRDLPATSPSASHVLSIGSVYCLTFLETPKNVIKQIIAWLGKI